MQQVTKWKKCQLWQRSHRVSAYGTISTSLLAISTSPSCASCSLSTHQYLSSTPRQPSHFPAEELSSLCSAYPYHIRGPNPIIHVYHEQTPSAKYYLHDHRLRCALSDCGRRVQNTSTLGVASSLKRCGRFQWMCGAAAPRGVVLGPPTELFEAHCHFSHVPFTARTCISVLHETTPHLSHSL